MSALQVLVATMNHQDTSLARKMNVTCDAIIANQADRNEVVDDGAVRMITTDTKGVGLNRNIALLAATADIVLFADDDVVYYNGMEKAVIQAFQDQPNADVIIFGMDITRGAIITERRHLNNRRLWVWNSMRFGTYRIAARRSSLLRENILFNQNFGGGCPFSSGEDSLFLKACFDKGLKVYGSEYVLGSCAKDSSTWFDGYHEKYFYDKGVLMRYLFPRIPRLMALYFAIRFKRETQLSPYKRVKLMLTGVREAKYMRPFRGVL